MVRARRARSINSINNSCIAGVRRGPFSCVAFVFFMSEGVSWYDRVCCCLAYVIPPYMLPPLHVHPASPGRAGQNVAARSPEHVPADQRDPSPPAAVPHLISGRRAARGQWHCMGGLNDTWPPDTNLRLHGTQIVDKLNTPTALVN